MCSMYQLYRRFLICVFRIRVICIQNNKVITLFKYVYIFYLYYCIASSTTAHSATIPIPTVDLTGTTSMLIQQVIVCLKKKVFIIDLIISSALHHETMY